MIDAYAEVIKTNPYAILAEFTYDVNPQPMVSWQEYDPDIRNDCESDGSNLEDKIEIQTQDKEVCDNASDSESDEEIRDHLLMFPKHSQFLLKFRNAKIAADRSNRKTFIHWMGHKTHLSPNAPKMNFPVFKSHLIKALANITDKSAEESEVCKFYYYYC